MMKTKSRYWIIIAGCILTGISLMACSRQLPTPVIAEKSSTEQLVPQSQNETPEKEQTLSQQLADPEHYQATVKMDHVEIVADAAVTVPQTDSIPVLSVEKAPYAEEDYEHFKRVISEEANIKWGMINKIRQTI